jgi:catechol 2,3-dioxygenase-like lactoylglutathione lyase family enzyme
MRRSAMSGGFHHVAYACRDAEETTRFYEDIGMPLLYTEVGPGPKGGYLRHMFFDTGDGSSLAFFDVHGVGEKEGWSSEISSGNGLPVWVNHVAFKATKEDQDTARARMDAAGRNPLMEIDHGWCHSLYYLDPNGIMIEFCRDTPGFKPDPERAHALLTAVPSDDGKRLGRD